MNTTDIFDYNIKVKAKPGTLAQQKELVASRQKALRARSKAEVLYQVLHDVQAVHQGVDSYLEILMNSELALGKADWDEVCREVRSKSRLVAEMVDCAIELAQYDDLPRVVLSDPVLVNGFCQDMLKSCERYLHNPNIELSLETTLSDDYMVRTHVGYLRKLIKNLLICAMHYTHEGYIRLAVTEAYNHKRLLLRLTNTGEGIPMHMQERLFEQLPSDGNMCNTIVGVRLRICHALAHKLGGTMFLDRQCYPLTSIVFSISL